MRLMSPRVQLPLLTAVLVLAGSAPALADSTVTGTVPPGGSLRSSPDAEASAANPLIVTVTTSGEYGSSNCRSNCSQGDSQVTIGLKDQHVHPAAGDAKPFYVVGPQVDVASSQNLNIDRIVFEIDSSVIRPNFALPVGEFEGRIWRP